IVPLCSNFSRSISLGRSGNLPPSYQVSVQAGNMSPRAGKLERIIDQEGAMSSFKGEESTSSTLLGAPSFSAQFAPSMTWQPMSPKAPQPKSHQPRQLNG